MKPLLDLTRLGNKDYFPSVPFINISNVLTYCRVITDTSYSHVIFNNMTIFDHIDKAEAELICEQINDWIRTHIETWTQIPINFKQPEL